MRPPLIQSSLFTHTDVWITAELIQWRNYTCRSHSFYSSILHMPASCCYPYSKPRVHPRLSHMLKRISASISWVCRCLCAYITSGQTYPQADERFVEHQQQVERTSLHSNSTLSHYWWEDLTRHKQYANHVSFPCEIFWRCHIDFEICK